MDNFYSIIPSLNFNMVLAQLFSSNNLWGKPVLPVCNVTKRFSYVQFMNQFHGHLKFGQMYTGMGITTRSAGYKLKDMTASKTM